MKYFNKKPIHALQSKGTSISTETMINGGGSGGAPALKAVSSEGFGFA
jgi:hypothetical protein